MEFVDTPLFEYLILPLLIIIARIFDVSLNTLRIIYLSKGYKSFVPILGFFEVLIWLLAVTRIFSDLDNWVAYLAYPLGFALGNFIGMKLEEKLAVGVELIRIITRKDAGALIEALRSKGFSVTAIKAEGSQGNVGVLYSIINRKNLEDYVNTIQEFNPNAFYTIEDVRAVSKHLPDTRTKLKERRKMKNVE
ncbi:MAG: DUF2179 domain-containing protein [Bacteroidales bacterium]|nr:DUF2179 domain-containing protein [Bacteroidales bacterium]MBN2817376.1 DUF2179 domain-containing protein [Bacteroidales bacterium]